MEIYIQAVDNLAKNKYTSCYSEPRSIVWKDDAKDLPSDAEIDAEVIRMEKEYSDNEYARNRASAYDSVGNQLDQQYWDQVNGTTTWKDAVAKVKADNPKPE
tara:strand:- start:300 stop:605 length:306 start_codon:yes stop_codon:yes gene_type:complete